MYIYIYAHYYDHHYDCHRFILHVLIIALHHSPHIRIDAHQSS